MLRLRSVTKRAGGPPNLLAAKATFSRELEVVPLFEDPRLELARLLREAANIEHALAVQYLYAAYSLKEAYFDAIAGGPDRNPSTLLGIAVQEMLHLRDVNQLLVAVGASPNFDRQDFPITTDIYPFAFDLERLSKASLAKYLVAESPPDALNPSTAPDAPERAFRKEVHALLGGEATNQIGSLYRTILARFEELVRRRPNLVRNPDYWRGRLHFILEEGETAHYTFFRSLFLGEHPALAGLDAWSDPNNDAYPSYPVALNPTAMEGAPNQIEDAQQRRLAMLANHHYWAMLALLQCGQLSGRAELTAHAKQHMTGGLHPLARSLAMAGSGAPFDAKGLNFAFGLDLTTTSGLVCDLMREAERLQEQIGVDLPIYYRKLLPSKTITLLGE